MSKKSALPATQVKVNYPIYTMPKNGHLTIPPEIVSQIQFLHSHCGKTEWSGLLFYDVVKGNPSDPKNFELEVKHIFLMDIGSAGATDYEPDGDLVDVFDQFDDAIGWKIGHIHTHHNGGAYFSGVDMDELMTNVDKHNYYLSLVVNFEGTYDAKVVFLSDMHTTSKMNFTNDSGEVEHFKQSIVEKHMVVIDMDIYYGSITSFFSDRINAVKKKKHEAKKNVHVTGFGSEYSNVPEVYNRVDSFTSNSNPNKMTSWEIDKLTKNILTGDSNLSTVTNVYAILHSIAREDPHMDVYPNQLMLNVESVISNFFVDALDDDEYQIVITEVIMCVKKYQGNNTLTDTVETIVEVLELVASQFDNESDTDVSYTSDDNDIGKTLERMENEL